MWGINFYLLSKKPNPKNTNIVKKKKHKYYIELFCSIDLNIRKTFDKIKLCYLYDLMQIINT